MTAEASILFFLSPNDGRYSYILTTPLFTYFMLRWLLSVDFKFKNTGIQKWMCDTNLIIYIVHPMVIYLLDFTDMREGTVRWLVVTLVSIGIASIFATVRNKLKNRNVG